jgi:hypothetical protein
LFLHGSNSTTNEPQRPATRVTDWPYPENADFVVLRDPAGNEFCVIDHAAL